jgi:hypothetical protein
MFYLYQEVPLIKHQGFFAPTKVYLSGSFKKTISSNSAFASSIPAISSNVIPVSGR